MSDDQSLSQSIDDDADARFAREWLREMIAFHQALVKEMEEMTAKAQRGAPIDGELLAKMKKVDEAYMDVMGALRQEEDEARDASLIYADVLQELMRYMSKQEEGDQTAE